MAETNDLSYRLLHRDTCRCTELKISHMTPSRKWALEDLNVAYPRDRLIELEAEGVFKKLAPNAVSMVGSITLYTELLNEVVPRIKDEFDQPGSRPGVDLAVLTAVPSVRGTDRARSRSERFADGELEHRLGYHSGDKAAASLFPGFPDRLPRRQAADARAAAPDPQGRPCAGAKVRHRLVCCMSCPFNGRRTAAAPGKRS